MSLHTKKQTFEMGNVRFVVDPKKTYIRMTFTVDGSRVQRSVKKNELWAMMFAVSKGKKQDDLVPRQKKEMMQFERQHIIQVTKDMKAGETIKVKCNVDVPLTVVESLITKQDLEVVKEKIKKSDAVDKAMEEGRVIPIDLLNKTPKAGV